MNYKLETVHAGQEKIIFFLGAQPGDKKFLQTKQCSRARLFFPPLGV
jgi:hypothetical protein